MPDRVNGSGAPGAPVTLPIELEQGMDPASLQFPTAGQPEGATVSDASKTLTVPGEGVWTVDPVKGALTFTPEAGFKGDPTPALFEVADVNGAYSKPGMASVDYPNCVDEMRSGDQGDPVSWNMRLESDIVLDSVHFTAYGQPEGAALSADGKTLTVPGDGVWRLEVKDDAAGGAQAITADATFVTFTPENAEVVRPASVNYTRANDAGALAVPAQLTVVYPDVRDVPPILGTPGVPVTITLNIAENIEPTSIFFPFSGQPAGAIVAADRKSITVPNEGTWSVNAGGTVTFTPQAGFAGNPAAVSYAGLDRQGNEAAPATMDVVYQPLTQPTPASGDQGAVVSVPLRLADGVTPSMLDFVWTTAPQGAVISPDGMTMTVPGQGVWTIDPATGAVSFAPEPTFQGDPTPRAGRDDRRGGHPLRARHHHGDVSGRARRVRHHGGPGPGGEDSARARRRHGPDQRVFPRRGTAS
ncbi:hypothetical protein JT358_00390 [Micrococcales bacterium 31B]|nr:hypothetical protein [Micrococcales bacterium 31B]